MKGAAEAFIDAMGKIGVTIEARKVTYQEAVALQFGEHNDYDIIVGSWGSDFPDPSGNLRPNFASENIVAGGANSTAYKNPTVDTLLADDNLANSGALEIIPLQQPLTLFVWSKSRVVPVRLTDFSITEDAFDPNLNPIRAKVSLGMRVLNVDDIGFSHPGGHLFMSYLTNKQQLASKAASVALSVLGLGGLP